MTSGLNEGDQWDITWWTDRDFEEVFEVFEDERATTPSVFSPGTTAVAHLKEKADGPIVAEFEVDVTNSPASIGVALALSEMNLEPDDYWWDVRKTEGGKTTPFITPSRFRLRHSVTELPVDEEP